METVLYTCTKVYISMLDAALLWEEILDGKQKKEEIMETGIVSVAAITIISYLVAQGVKATSLDNKWLPVICGLVGAVLGYIAMNVMPGYPAEDPITAIAVGIASGLAATGSNELIKQLRGGRVNEDK